MKKRGRMKIFASALGLSLLATAAFASGVVQVYSPPSISGGSSSQNTFASSVTVNGAGGILTESSVTASAFFGDGSHISGITQSQWIANGSKIYYNNGSVGIGLTNPTTAFSVQGVGNALSVFGIATSSTPIPSISCTAGAGAMGANSGSQSGTFAAGTAATACTVTFGTSFPKVPVCICNASTPLSLSATTTTSSVTCTALTALTGDTLNYFCWSAP